MNFSSPEFLIFIFALIFIYALLPSVTSRKWALICGSLFFIVWTGITHFLIFFSMALLSWLSVFISNRSNATAKNRHKALIAGVTILVLNFCYWKYLPSRFRVPYPLGLSFSTLQGIAYLVEYGQGRAEFMSFSDYFLFRGLFAQLIAGPIVRARELLPQIQSLKKIEVGNLAAGSALFILGLSKKLLIADRVGCVVDPIFLSPESYLIRFRVLGALAYTVQIWADFSGYTDMARGSARLFGIVLPENFVTPYFSTSMRDYWSRWHITFTSWVKEFLFFPLALAFGRLNQNLIVLALISTTAISGIWHGWMPTFLLWGLYHGIILGIEHGLKTSGIFKSLQTESLKIFRGLLTFTAVCVGLVIFRSPDLRILKQYFSFHSNASAMTRSDVLTVTTAVATCLLLHALFYFDFRELRKSVTLWTKSASPLYLRAAGCFLGLVALAIFVGAVLFHPHHLNDPFVYFQF